MNTQGHRMPVKASELSEEDKVLSDEIIEVEIDDYRELQYHNHRRE